MTSRPGGPRRVAAASHLGEADRWPLSFPRVPLEVAPHIITKAAGLASHVSRRFLMLYLVGLGLGDAEDITVKGLRVVRRCARVYLEAYTSVLTCGTDALEAFYGRRVILADREMVEQRSDEILDGADVDDVAFLVVGDPFGATTHAGTLKKEGQRGDRTIMG